MEPLSYDEWLRLAAERGLIWTPDNIHRAKLNVPYYALEVDYINFTVNEWHNFGFQTHVIYEPVDLEPFRIILTRLGGKKCSECGMGYPVSVIPWVDGDAHTDEGPYERDLVVECEPWLSSGNGDGWTRYVFWDDIQDMPAFYFTEFQDDESRDEDIRRKTGRSFVSRCDYLTY